MSWYHKNSIISDVKQFPLGTFGFVYMITNLDTQEFYIGRKQIEQKVTKTNRTESYKTTIKRSEEKKSRT